MANNTQTNFSILEVYTIEYLYIWESYSCLQLWLMLFCPVWKSTTPSESFTLIYQKQKKVLMRDFGVWGKTLSCHSWERTWVLFEIERLYWRYSFGIVRYPKLEAGYLLHKKFKGAKIVKFFIFNLDFSRCPPITLNLKLNLFLMEHYRRGDI